MITIVRLVTTPSYRTIAIQKLNNITINRLTHLQPSVLVYKWRFDTSQDWEVLGDDFDSVSSDTIPDSTLQTLGFYLSPLGYLEKRAPQFVDVTNKPELAIGLENNAQPITKSEDNETRKGLEYIAKRKVQRDHLRAPVQAFAACSTAFSSSCPESPALLLSCPPVPALSLSHLPMSTLSSTPVPALSTTLVSTLLFPPILALSSCSMLGLAPTHLISSTLRTFKWALSDKSLRRHSTSLIKRLCPFQIFGPLSKKSKCNWLFNTAFKILTHLPAIMLPKRLT